MLFVMLMLTLGAQPLSTFRSNLYLCRCGWSVWRKFEPNCDGRHDGYATDVQLFVACFYMLAQLLGGWVALIIVNAFRLGSGTSLPLPEMSEISGESFLGGCLG